MSLSMAEKSGITHMIATTNCIEELVHQRVVNIATRTLICKKCVAVEWQAVFDKDLNYTVTLTSDS